MIHLHNLPLTSQRSRHDSVPAVKPCFKADASLAGQLTRIFGEYLLIIDFCYRVKWQIQGSRIHRNSRDQSWTQIAKPLASHARLNGNQPRFPTATNPQAQAPAASRSKTPRGGRVRPTRCRVERASRINPTCDRTSQSDLRARRLPADRTIRGPAQQSHATGPDRPASAPDARRSPSAGWTGTRSDPAPREYPLFHSAKSQMP